MEALRAVEVLHDRGEGVSPRWLLGSGFVVKTDVVLTAAHNLGQPSECGPLGTVVRTLDGTERSAKLIVRTEELDLALLAVPGIKLEPVKLGRLDRTTIDVVRDVMAVGFPNYKFATDRPPAQRRQPAQPVGTVPTVEGVSGGVLTLKVEAAEPAVTSSTSASSPWEGLSGSGVFVAECLFAVVVEHHLAEGMGALQLIPLARLIDLPGPDGAMFRAVLGLEDVVRFEAIGATVEEPTDADPVLTGVIKELQDLMKLGERGLLTPAEVSTLKLTAYKEAKGWK